MKKFFALVVAFATLLVACEPSGGESVAKSNIKLVATSLVNVGAEGDTRTVNYTITEEVAGAEVKASADVSWISDYVYGDGEVTYTVAANNTTEQRIGKVTLSYADSKATFAVMQAAGEEYKPRLEVLSAHAVEFTPLANEAEISYTISARGENEFPTATTDASWITIAEEIGVDTIAYSVAANTSQELRVATIDVSFEDYTISVEVTQLAALNEVSLHASNTVAHVGDSVEFTVIYGSEDVTAAADIYRRDGDNPIKIEGHSVALDTVGEHSFYAVYNDNTSKDVVITIMSADAPAFPEDTMPMNFNFKHRVLLVQHTGTACPNCPRMTTALRDLMKDKNYGTYFNIAASRSYTSSDPAYSIEAKTIWNYYKSTCIDLTGYPSATFNFQYVGVAGGTVQSLSSHLDKVYNADGVDAGVALGAEVVGEKVLVSVSLKSAVAANYHLALWVLEDDVYGYQSGASESWMHYHNNCFRAWLGEGSRSDISGVNWGEVAEKSISHKVYEIPVENDWVKDNLKVLAIISRPTTSGKYEVVNTTVCKVGDSASFNYTSKDIM